jgi:hypothetical protein
VALGGELITRVANDTSIGKTFDERLAWLRSQLVGLREKIECLAALHLPGRPTTAETSPVTPLEQSQSTVDSFATM